MEAKEEEPEVPNKTELVPTTQPKEAAKKVEAVEEVDKPLVMNDLSKPTPISMPMPKSIIEPIYEDDFYDDGEFAYDEYGNVIGRVNRNELARERWHWAFTKIVQVRSLHCS